MSDGRDKIMSLNACTYEMLSKNSKVFNVDTNEYHLWIYLNPEDVRQAYFLGAEEKILNKNGFTTEIHFDFLIYRKK